MKISRLYTAAVSLVLLWALGIGLYQSYTLSMTTDEGIHIASGYLTLTRHEFRMDPEHPPLFKVISALPLLALNLHNPTGDQEDWEKMRATFYDSWAESRGWSNRWIFESGNNADLTVFLGRIPAVLTFVFLCWFTFYLGRLWFGPKVGLLAMIFTAFNPTLIAHGALANDDVAIGLCILGAIWSFWKYLSQPTPRNAVLVGALLGVSLGVKYTALALIPLAFVIVLLPHLRKEHRNWKTAGKHFLLFAITTWLTIWAAYGFQSEIYVSPGSMDKLTSFSAVTEHLSADQMISYARIIAHILPAQFIKGSILVQGSSLLGRGAYVLNHHYNGGVWFYFPVVFALKTQLIALIILGIGGVLACIRRSWKLDLPRQILAATFIFFLIISIVNKLDLGIRHITSLLVMLSFYLALCTVAIADLWKQTWLLTLLLLLYILPVLAQGSNIFGFTSELVQPYDQAYLYMEGSNYDWGQQAKEIAAYVKSQPYGTTIAANYYWSPALPYYGITTKSFDPEILPTNTLILLTASQLSENQYLKFRKIEPFHVIGNHTFFYYLR